MDFPEETSFSSLDYFTSIPHEILEVILSYCDVSLKDVYNVSLTCRYLKNTVYSLQHVWKKKIFTTWPFLKDAYGNRTQTITRWYNQCRHIGETELYCRNYLMGLSPKFYWRLISMSNCDVFDIYTKSKENDGLAMLYIINYLRFIHNSEVDMSNPLTRSRVCTLTTQYYAGIILEYLVHIQLSEEWNKLINEESFLVPDKVALFFVQWILPKSEKQDKEVSDYLWSVVDKVQALVPRLHPLKTVSRCVMEHWTTRLHSDNIWEPRDSQILIQTISHVLIKVEGFSAAEIPGAKYFDIGEAIRSKVSHRLILTIIFETIARRCGLRCDIICSVHHMFVRWRANWSQMSSNFILEITTGTLRPSQGACPYAPPNAYDERSRMYSPVSLLANLAADIHNVFHLYDLRTGHNALSLLHFLYPDNSTFMCFVAKNLIVQNKDLRPIMTLLKQKRNDPDAEEDRGNINLILEEYNEIERRYNGHTHKKILVHKRPPKLLFAVGMVCFHKVHRYLCVIRGWDPTCEASQDWQRSMGVPMLKYGASQPFYKAVAEDNSDRYVAQENLTFRFETKRMKVVEETIAKEFSHFNGYFYVPNEEKQFEYPDDKAYTSFFKSRMKPEI